MQNQIFTFVLILHIISGTIGLLTGTFQMLSNKLTKQHKLIGRLFFYAMIGIFITSIYLSISTNNVFLLLVGFFSFYLSATGYRVLYLKELHIKPIKPTWVDNLINYTGIIAGLGLLALAIIYFTRSNNFFIVTAAFGFISLQFGIRDALQFYKRPTYKLHWLEKHGMRMAGAYTATVTAFVVVNIKIQQGWVLWLLPAAIIIPITKMIINKIKTNKMKTNIIKTNYFALLAIVCTVSSCAYNNKFLAPKKYDATTTQVTYAKNEKDSFIAKYDVATHKPTFLKNGIDTVDISYTIESVVFKSSTGNTLNGWMLKHKQVKPTHTIVNFHGNGGSILGQASFILPLLDQGFQIFVFDYSGYGFSTGKAKRQYLPKDGLSAIEYVKGRPDCKDQKLILYGQSYGGHLAACVAPKANDLIDAVVIEGGFSNHKSLGSSGAKPFIAFMSKIFIKEFYSGTKEIGKIKKPLLIIHSKEDETIPYKMGEALYKKATTKKEFYTVSGKHLIALKTDKVIIANKIKEMVK